MYVLEPIFHKTIWGGNRLVGIYGESAAGLAHLYSLRCNAKESNLVMNGRHAGRSLQDLIGIYPLSIAILDAASDLSIQVHPGGAAAKHESYYFMERPASGWIYCGMPSHIGGLAEGKGRDIADGIAESLQDGSFVGHVGHLAVEGGDYVHIAPGTVHAVTAGSLAYEIEQGEDNTYRLCDYGRIDSEGRQRELHIALGLKAVEPSAGAEARRYPLDVDDGIREETYATKLLTDICVYENGSNGMECFTLLEGAVEADGIAMKMGMTAILEPGERIGAPATIKRAIVAKPLGNRGRMELGS
jgi:mannose-6-phosphate isomerase